MKSSAKVFALLLCIFMVFSMIPVSVQASNQQNAGDTQQENRPDAVLLLDSGSDTYVRTAAISANSVSVTVTAESASTHEQVPVEDATVTLYVGAEARKTAKTDAEGKATLSLSGLSETDLLIATVSAYKTVAQGRGYSGTDRDLLFSTVFPTDETSGEPIRFEYQLHSERIDPNGNWLGQNLPIAASIRNRADVVFVIDSTGSMSDEINNVKENVKAFSEELIHSSIDCRIAIIEYRDITCGEDTILHTIDGGHWLTDTDSVEAILSDIHADGGGDTPESVVDALGLAASGEMLWRSNANRFAFLLTDADYKTENNFDYSSMDALIEDLKEKKIMTSVITSSDYNSLYRPLFEGTGGIYANINSSSFQSEMLKLADSIIEYTISDMELVLKEPRMLYNLTVCYLANDDTSRSEAYRNSMKNMLNEYAKHLAQTTDGHVLINKVYLFSTDSLMKFYQTEGKVSMSDIHIQTREKDDGEWWFNVKIHSNAYVDGFYSDTPVDSDADVKMFEHLKNPSIYNGKKTYQRIQMSATEGAGWNLSFIDDAWDYAATLTHESGHYLFGFRDEYLDSKGDSWGKNYQKPYAGFGLMDNTHEDIEMSKDSIDYQYLIDKTSTALTKHRSYYNEACEDTLADLLTTGISSYYQTRFYSSPYIASYTKAPGNDDRHTSYSYAELTEANFEKASPTASPDIAVLAEDNRGFEAAESSRLSFGRISVNGAAQTVVLSIQPKSDYTYTLYAQIMGEDGFSTYALTEDGGILTTELPIPLGGMAELKLVAERDGASWVNTYYIDRSEETDTGYLYTSSDYAVTAYFTNNVSTSYTLLADNTSYENGEYVSVNQALLVSTDNDAAIEDGEIYSVASKNAKLDFTTLSWFKFADGAWTMLDTDFSEEENLNVGARADLQGAGLYVLMAKPAADTEVSAVQNLAYSKSDKVDALVTLTFDDPNADSKYYNVYYSESEFSSLDDDGLVVRTYSADSTELNLNLIERNRTVYAAVEVVLENGARSPLSAILLISGEADSDGDGIPDWYCDKYHLWPKNGEEKDIANSDDDGDGLTNLEEYRNGSDPTDPDDPVHTTNIPLEKVEMTPPTAAVQLNKTVQLKALLTPENASNQTVTWRVDDDTIASITPNGLECEVKGLSLGTTRVYVITKDGGYIAACTITVSENTGGGGGGAIVVTTFRVAVEKAEHGTVTVSKTRANRGDMISIVPAPEDGYELDTIAVQDQIGRPIDVETEDGKYFFKMPGMNVKVTATFRNAEGSADHQCYAETFTDVNPDLWYHEAIDYVVGKGLMRGVSDSSFAPNETTSRGMIVTILYRLEGDPDMSGTKSLFSDVDDASWYANAVTWAHTKGIIQGYGNGKFGPDDFITREQMAVILYRYAQIKRYDVSKAADLNEFADNNMISKYAIDGVRWAVAEGLILGVSNSRLNPRDNATRAQAAAILMRFSALA